MLLDIYFKEPYILETFGIDSDSLHMDILGHTIEILGDACQLVPVMAIAVERYFQNDITLSVGEGKVVNFHIWK